MPVILPNLKKERLRLAAMKRYLHTNINQDERLQDIAVLASKVTNTPVALVTLMDKDVQWITSSVGFEIESMPRKTSFCTHTIEQEKVMVVKDSKLDARFKKNPIVLATPSARFYAGMPLKSHDGLNIGTLCVLDVKPRGLTRKQSFCLEALAKQAITLMEHRLNIELLREGIEQIELKNTTLKKIAQFQSHEFRGPLTTVIGLMNLIKDEGYAFNKDYMLMMETAIQKLDEKICSVVGMAMKEN